MLHTISPVDGRYADKTSVLSSYFSEAALLKYRCLVEIEYLIALIETGIIPDAKLTSVEKSSLKKIVTSF
ncbi:MAG: adenylosuccinate lyase, partial [Saprospiraceae bacterium]